MESLSLFSGCGGMDSVFEGGWCLGKSVSEKLRPDRTRETGGIAADCGFVGRLRRQELYEPPGILLRSVFC